jgi:hypothetical protein
MQNATTASLSQLCRLVLSEELDKDPVVRMSCWTSPTLSKEQQKYAALDAIVSLDIYRALETMEDLTTRMSIEEAMPGTLVDVMSPHCSGDTDKIMSGYGKDHDLMTRAAVGEILDADGEVLLPTEIETVNGFRRCKADGKTTFRVRVKKVTSQFLALPNLRKRHKGKGRARRACLVDFDADNEFEIVVPLVMLRKHREEGNVRNFMGVSVAWICKHQPLVEQDLRCQLVHR